MTKYSSISIQAIQGVYNSIQMFLIPKSLSVNNSKIQLTYCKRHCRQTP